MCTFEGTGSEQTVHDDGNVLFCAVPNSSHQSHSAAEPWGNVASVTEELMFHFYLILLKQLYTG